MAMKTTALAELKKTADSGVLQHLNTWLAELLDTSVRTMLESQQTDAILRAQGEARAISLIIKRLNAPYATTKD